MVLAWIPHAAVEVVGNTEKKEMFGRFMVTSHRSEGQGEDSKADERPENHAPILSPVSGFLGIWSVVTSLKLSDVMDKMRRRSGLDRFKVHLSLRKCHTVPPAASGTQKDHTVHTASYLMRYCCCFLCPCRLLTENECLRQIEAPGTGSAMRIGFRSVC